jgi:hypothetical protein
MSIGQPLSYYQLLLSADDLRQVQPGRSADEYKQQLTAKRCDIVHMAAQVGAAAAPAAAADAMQDRRKCILNSYIYI